MDSQVPIIEMLLTYLTFLTPSLLLLLVGPVHSISKNCSCCLASKNNESNQTSNLGQILLSKNVFIFILVQGRMGGGGKGRGVNGV